MSKPLTLDDIHLDTIFDVDYTVNKPKKAEKDQIIDENTKNTENLDIIPKNTNIIPKTTDIIIDNENKEDIAPGFIKCQICGKFFKTITMTHLITHNLTMAQYREQFPKAPIIATKPEPLKPLEEITYIDIDGKIRYKDNHQLVDEQALLDKFDLSKYEEMELDFKFLAMSKSKKALMWLDDVMVYDSKKSKDKLPRYTPAVQIKAAELILQYGPPKAAQRKEVNTTIKKLSVTIGATLPNKLKVEDF